MIARRVVLSMLMVFWCRASGVLAAPLANCSMPFTELQAGVTEIDLGNVKVKTESYNKIAKMKLIGEVNEDWTSVSTEDDSVGLITGYVGNGDAAKVIAELVIQQVDEAYTFAVFKADARQLQQSRVTGVAYFYEAGQVTCIPTTYKQWLTGRGKIFGTTFNQSAINLEPDGFG
jgi:hypothetical protein